MSKSESYGGQQKKNDFYFLAFSNYISIVGFLFFHLMILPLSNLHKRTGVYERGLLASAVCASFE